MDPFLDDLSLEVAALVEFALLPEATFDEVIDAVKAIGHFNERITEQAAIAAWAEYLPDED